LLDLDLADEFEESMFIGADDVLDEPISGENHDNFF
jgi:hypothetical protein